MTAQRKYVLTFTALISISIGLTIIAPAAASQKAESLKPFKAGRVSSAIVNTILSGNQPPKSDDGIDGDFYIDSKSVIFFGPKTKGRWPTGISLRGATGVPGSDGKNGSDGKSVTNISGTGLQGSVGPIGPRGDIGPQGIAGAQGARGDTGPKGDSGAKGEAGAAGLPGAIGPQGLQGITGSQGLAGTNGTVGAQGAQGTAGANGAQGTAGSPGVQGLQGNVGTAGATGATGAAGAAGSSKSLYGNITFASQIQGSVGTSQPSNAFGGFLSGKSYLLRIHIKTYNTTKNLSTYPLSFSLSAQGASPSLFQTYSIVVGSNWVSSAKQDEVNVVAEIAIDGSSTTSDYSFIVTIACGTATGVFPIALSGTYVAHEVSQVSAGT